MTALDRFFEISARGSTIATELRGGVVTFIAMAYILVLNPIILSGTADIAGHKLAFHQVSAVTSLAAGVMTIIFAVVARMPFAFAAGLGINSFLASSVVSIVTWPEAMGLVIVEGLIIVALALTGLRRLIFDAVPMPLKLAITAGIGLFIMFIGLVDAGFVASTGHPSPPLGLGSHGTGSVSAVPTLVFVFTLLVTGILVARKTRGAILIGLITGTVVAAVIEAIWHLGSVTEHPGGWSLSVPTLSGSPFAMPDLALVGQFNLDSFERIGVLAACMLVFTLLFTNFFDAMGTFTGLGRQTGLADEHGNFPRLQSALVVEGTGAVLGGAASASSNTVFVESGTGIGEGARTGLASLVTGGLFLAAMFLTPLAAIVPSEVAAAALVIVGTLMVSVLHDIDFSEFSVALPVVLTVAVMPLSYSIANGIGVGFIAWAVLRSASGKAREVSPLLWIVAVGFVFFFARGWIDNVIGFMR
ncbi:NCS2 family permease [Mycobacterium sp. OTB74]|uniref:NCS2 family permease n=1 Tax=Mycobacterium sp. OTB74 TaxID=1853452 RepID=UPI0024757785|nr:NCS2 family permease [Mycobacterium sp. OTB74]MDH6245751.1 AGZA family xanthine/uracil permease-like MFS transporter [Mycobacterium sp. OTB74]